MNLTGKYYTRMCGTVSNWTMPAFARPVWRSIKKINRHGQQEETT
jgi:hypothetical protein